MKKTIQKNKEVINSTLSIVVVKRELVESGPGIALSPKLVVGT